MSTHRPHQLVRHAILFTGQGYSILFLPMEKYTATHSKKKKGTIRYKTVIPSIYLQTYGHDSG